MNRYKITQCIFSLLFVFFFSCQQTPDSGLVVFYPFTGHAGNESGAGNDGVAEGVVLTSDRFGIENSAYHFDGVQAFILVQVTDMPALDAPQSILWWYWIDAMPNFSDPMGAGNMFALVDTSAGVGIQAGFRGVGYNTLGFDVWKWGGGTLLQASPPAVKVWHFCAYTFDGRTHRLYIDGDESVYSTEAPHSGHPSLLMFGNYPSGEQFFTGRLDDIRIYNRALALSEIKSFYKEK